MFVRDPVSYLRLFLQDRQAVDLQPCEVVYVLKTAAREILPGAGLEKRCQQLEVFADWVAHDEITRSAAGAVALIRIADAIPLHGSDAMHDNKWLEEAVNDDLSFWKLRLDLIAFSRRFDLPEGMFATADAWNRFALPLALEVSGRPVSLSPTHGGPIGQARDRLAHSVLAEAHRPTSLTIVGETPTQWRWQIQTARAPILVQVLFGSFRHTDFPVPAGWVSPLAGKGR